MTPPSLDKLGKLAPPPTTDVVRLLLDYVLRSGEVGIGDKLPPERQFAEALGVGRSLVREALKSLNLLGLVEIRQGDGTYVASHSSELLPRVIEWGLLLGQQRTLETVEARQHIEVLIAGLAASRRDQPAIDRLQAILQEMEAAADDPEVLIAADIAFHMEVAHTAGNRVLSNILSSLQSLLRVWIGRVIAENHENAALTIEEHRNIFHAIRDGNEAQARAAMAAHLADARRRLEVSIEGATAVPDASAGSIGG